MKNDRTYKLVQLASGGYVLSEASDFGKRGQGVAFTDFDDFMVHITTNEGEGLPFAYKYHSEGGSDEE